MQDLRENDLDLYNNYSWMLENDVTSLDSVFVVTEEISGKRVEVKWEKS